MTLLQRREFVSLPTRHTTEGPPRPFATSTGERGRPRETRSTLEIGPITRIRSKIARAGQNDEREDTNSQVGSRSTPLKRTHSPFGKHAGWWVGGEVGRFTAKSRLFQTKGYEERIVDESRDFQAHVLLEIRDSGPCPAAFDPVDRTIVVALLGKGLLHLGGDIEP